ncbi:putative membrane-associated kinase regulator 6 [Cocos nucifera]|uniref:Putative membrane-associated kinase regulator 6 n=1 Tax=Cocos nucifera TaxID=13894 RepID=A0A8K0IM39_COCNU|nr:putative membrane-associated kinase regulator 6 [Cocos nucifera]
METSQQLFGDSFSYGWLVNIKPSFESFSSSFRHSFDGSSFIEMDPDFFSMRWTSDAHDFTFNPLSTPSPVSAHADQIFSNGHLVQLHLSTPPPQSEEGHESLGSNLSRSKSLDSSKALLLYRSNRFQSQCFHAIPSRPVSSNSSPLFHSAQSTPVLMSSCSSKSVASRSGKSKSSFFKNCARSPKKILWKYLCFLMPLYKKVKGLSSTSPKSGRSCRNSVGNSPRMTTACSSKEWRCGNADSSIYDAILHCKKSIVGTGFMMEAGERKPGGKKDPAGIAMMVNFFFWFLSSHVKSQKAL